ncbi:hypothetical protein NST17_03495 [Caldifermentibacillus hisashii]|uniref:Uncharacterized protein n=1 Tax=Caldifermentibacillus hisashii TaxID=996558 RepID=A0ABU9JTV7_9BACI
MATKPFLVAVLRSESRVFGDEPFSRRHFEPRNPIFWRRALISSLFLGRKLDFLATRLVLVVVFRSESRVFGDEPFSRHHFEPRNPIFWRRALISSSF